MNNKKYSWQIYEQVVSVLESGNYKEFEFSITRNAKLVGKISETKRQIDVLIDSRWGDINASRIIIDAKNYARKLNIKDIEAFEGMLRDCAATHGILICPNGWSKAAEIRAQSFITLK